MRNQPLLRKHLFLLALTLACAAATIPSNNRVLSTGGIDILPSVKNSTQTLHVVSQAIVGHGVAKRCRLTLKNQCNRTITAFVVSVGKIKIQMDLIETNSVIRPRHEFVYDVPPSLAGPQGPFPDITVMSVL